MMQLEGSYDPAPATVSRREEAKIEWKTSDWESSPINHISSVLHLTSSR